MKHLQQEPREDGPPEKKSKKGKIILGVVLALCVLIGSVIAVVYHYIGKINYTPLDEFGLATAVPTDEIDEEIDPSLPAEEDPGEIELADGELLRSADVQNILLIGSDKRDGGDYGRSDSMMLVSIDRKTHRVIMTSFSRDLYVKIEGVKDNRINVAYGYGGPKLLIETIEKNFRIDIDNYIRVDFQSFRDIVDAIGGVDIQLTYSEAKELNDHPKRYGNAGPIMKVTKGINHLNGVTALAFARIRKIDGDIQRTQRQRTVMQAMIGKLKALSVMQIFDLADRFLPAIQTDLTSSEIAGLIWSAPGIMQYEIAQGAVPFPGTWRIRVIRKMSVLWADIEKNKQAVWALIYNK
jgi:LCP family protein required for cell wall assembly